MALRVVLFYFILNIYIYIIFWNFFFISKEKSTKQGVGYYIVSKKGTLRRSRKEGSVVCAIGPHVPAATRLIATTLRPSVAARRTLPASLAPAQHCKPPSPINIRTSSPPGPSTLFLLSYCTRGAIIQVLWSYWAVQLFWKEYLYLGPGTPTGAASDDNSSPLTINPTTHPLTSPPPGVVSSAYSWIKKKGQTKNYRPLLLR